MVKLKALGFIGIMVQGAHHQPHHLIDGEGRVFSLNPYGLPMSLGNCVSSYAPAQSRFATCVRRMDHTLGHLPTAINVPLKVLEARLVELDRSQEIMAYRRGPYCVLSYEAVNALRTRDFKVRRLRDWFPE